MLYKKLKMCASVFIKNKSGFFLEEKTSVSTFCLNDVKMSSINRRSNGKTRGSFVTPEGQYCRGDPVC